MLKRNIRSVLAILVITFVPFSYWSSSQHRSKQKPIIGEKVLWVDPGDPSTLDFEYGIGGIAHKPQPPFRFVDEDESGTNPKVNVTDAAGREWNVKWGEEVSPSVFCTRLAWACGYFTQYEYFVARGRIEGAHGLHRADSKILSDGSFVGARFQLRNASPRYMNREGWSWTKNPFAGTPELRGLKILMLLVSNWDAKDSRDRVVGPNGKVKMDSNLSVFSDDRNGEPRFLFANDDWGASLGKWGGFLHRTKWDCDGFTEQTSDFVKLLNDGSLKWAYDGKHRKDVIADIRTADVQWLLQYLGKITDEQIRRGLMSSGATPSETACFSKGLRQRIEMLQEVSGNAVQSSVR